MPHGDDLKKLITNHNRRLQILKQKQALSGLETDAKTLIEIEDIETQIQQLIEELESLNIIEALHSSTIADHTNLLAIEQPYGTMNPKSSFYIERTADGDCWQYLASGHPVTLFIQAPRQMGKSSLMHRVIDRAKGELKKRFVFIDFQEFPKQYFTATDEQAFLIGICSMIGRTLGVHDAIDQYWQGRESNIVKCGLYLADHIIPRAEGPFILALDEVDRLLPSPFRDDFFGMLRAWHNKRAYEEPFRKMSIFLSSSTESTLLIESEDQSPFNVADNISLKDFTRDEVTELNRRHHSPLDHDQLKELVDLIEGHPFLTRVALYQLATGNMSVATLFTQATSHSGPFGGHLQYYANRVFNEPVLKQALQRILREDTWVEERAYYQLKGLGLIKRIGKQVAPRNKLYARYFGKRLNV